MERSINGSLNCHVVLSEAYHLELGDLLLVLSNLQNCEVARRLSYYNELRMHTEREHLVSDKASHIFKRLQNSEHCCALCSVDCFHILDHASTGFQLKIKETFHIQRQKPSLNQQVHHVNLKLSF